jgi:hypothetical protein
VRGDVIAPGVIAHLRFEQLISQELAEATKSQIAMRRLGRPPDIAAMGVLLKYQIVLARDCDLKCKFSV